MVRRASGRGFTLIEMAIVVVIIGLLLSGSLLAVSPVIQGSKISDTNARLDRLEQALTVYVIQNACLPCPADNSLASSSANAGWAHGSDYYGLTNTNVSQQHACSSTSVCSAVQGVMPWNTLGLSESDVTDAWGNRIEYAVTQARTGTSQMVRTPPSTYPAGALIVDNNASTVQQQTNVAAYVLISHGPDQAYAYKATYGGTAGISPQYTFTGQATIKNYDGGTASPRAATDHFAQGDYVAATNNTHFDDLVRWRTGPIIIQGCGPNACGNPSQ